MYSDNFVKFLEVMQQDAVSPDEMILLLKTAIPYIEEELHLGYIETSLESPSILMDSDRSFCHVVLYSNESGYEIQPESFSFSSGIQGQVSIRIYPRKGYLWTEEEKKGIYFLAQNLYILCGRSRYLGIAEKASVTDNLTGAANLHGLSRFGKLIRKNEMTGQYSGVYLNIKGFKYINQKAGNRAGDDVLIQYVDRLKAFVGPDGIVARLGSDNFAVLILDSRIGQLMEFVRHMSINITVKNEPTVFEVATRIGAYKLQPEDSLAEFMNAASSALKVARRNIRKKEIVWYEPYMLEQEIKNIQITSLFGKALEEGEFVVYYQPKVSLADNHLCGCEALVRWIRNGKTVPAIDFIPALEEDGDVCRLDFYVFEKVCQDLRRWIDTGIVPVKVSVNFSKLHLYDSDFADSILSIVDRYQVDPRYLEIELTETSNYEDYANLIDFISCLKRSGIAISIDDFGTGYSSLSLLKDLDVDIVKLDKSFINNLDFDMGDDAAKNDSVVVRNIIKMVRELNMELIAEGVETEKQAEYLKSVKCSMAQGFLYDRPMPCRDFECRLKHKRKYR